MRSVDTRLQVLGILTTTGLTVAIMGEGALRQGP